MVTWFRNVYRCGSQSKTQSSGFFFSQDSLHDDELKKGDEADHSSSEWPRCSFRVHLRFSSFCDAFVGGNGPLPGLWKQSGASNLLGEIATKKIGSGSAKVEAVEDASNRPLPNRFLGALT